MIYNNGQTSQPETDEAHRYLHIAAHAVTTIATNTARLPSLANYSADKTAVGEGAVVSPKTLRALGPAFVPIGFAVDLASGATIDDLQADGPGPGANLFVDALRVSRPRTSSSSAT